MDDLSEIKTARRWVFRFLMVLVMLSVLYEALVPRNLSFPHSPETIQAIKAWQASPTPEHKVAMLKQFHQDVLHNLRDVQIEVGLLLLAGLVALYFLWNYGLPKAKT